MKELELDLRDIDQAVEQVSWADHPARAWLEDALLDFAGDVVIVRITRKKTQPWGNKTYKGIPIIVDESLEEDECRMIGNGQRGGAVVARQLHNLKVVSSNLTPATDYENYYCKVDAKSKYSVD